MDWASLQFSPSATVASGIRREAVGGVSKDDDGGEDGGSDENAIAESVDDAESDDDDAKTDDDVNSDKDVPKNPMPRLTTNRKTRGPSGRRLALKARPDDEEAEKVE